MGGVNKREHLLVSGQNVIWEKGYDRCSVKDITDEAGLPKGSFYHYFESKEKFAIEAMKHFIENHPEKKQKGEASIEDFEKIIDNRIEAIIKIDFARECYMSVMCHSFSDQEDGFRKEILKSIDDSNQTMRSLIEELHWNNLIRKELEVEELMEFIDLTWRGARLKARLLKSSEPLLLFKKYIMNYILSE